MTIRNKEEKKDKKEPIKAILDAFDSVLGNLTYYASRGVTYRKETSGSRRELIQLCELLREIIIPSEQVKDVVKKLEEVKDSVSEFLCPIIYFKPLILEIENNLK